MNNPGFRLLFRTWSFVPVLIACSALAGRAQPLVVDPAFAPQLLDQDSAAPATELVTLDGGSFLAYGPPQWLEGQPVETVFRLTADGSRDPSFVFAGEPLEGPALVLPLNGDRVLVIRFSFVTANRSYHTVAERHLADGSLDPTYAAIEFQASSFVRAQRAPSGRIVIAGEFSTVAGIARPRMARLNADGTFDAAFAPTVITASDHITSFVVGPEDAVTLVGWDDGATSNGYVLRLKADGSRDETFQPDLNEDPYWQFDPLLAQVDGKIVVRDPFRRLNADGSVDDTFVSGVPEGHSVAAVAALPDGRLAVETWSYPQNGVRTDVFLLSADGGLLANLAELIAVDELIDLAAVTPGGDIVVRHGPAPSPFPYFYLGPDVRPIGSDRIAYLPPPRTAWFARIKSDLTLDGTFASTLAQTGAVERVEAGPDNTVIISGKFTLVNGTPRPGLARLHVDGSVDDSMTPPDGTDRFSIIHQLDDGRLLAYIARATLPLPGIPEVNRNGIVRLLVDGTLDPTFTAASELFFAPAHVRAIEEDGSIIVSKPSDTPGFVVLARYTADGIHVADLPTEFPAYPPVYINASAQTAAASVGLPWAEPNTFYDSIQRVTLAPDGGYHVLGNFYGLTVPFLPAGIVRLHADGTLDDEYTARISELPSSQAVALLRDGKALFRVFDSIHGPGIYRTIRVNADGTRDTSFRPIDGNDLLYPHELSDGSILDLALEVMKWFADGTLDANVHVSLSRTPYGLGSDVLETADGGFYLGGNFAAVKDEPCTGLARLMPEVTSGITVTPEPQTVVAGHTARFTVAVGDGGPVTYQWQRNGVDITGATGAELIIENAGPDDAGSYRAVVTAGGSTYTSAAATLTVDASDARLVNFSARSRVGAGTLPQIAGFVTRTSGAAHPVLLRAIELNFSTGPAQQVVPRLGLFRGIDEIAFDTDSADTAPILAISRRLGAFDPPIWQPVPGLFNNRDAALATDLMTGGYTAQISATQTGSGICLFEFYDAPDTPQPGIVLNASLRARTAPDLDTMIGGFVIGGTQPLRVLLRVIGPELADWDVADPLGDPVLTLFDRWGQRLASNDDWENQNDGNVADVIDATHSSGAFDLTPGGTSAALFVSLMPGTYTIHATSNTAGAPNESISASGQVLLEIYVVED